MPTTSKSFARRSHHATWIISAAVAMLGMAPTSAAAQGTSDGRFATVRITSTAADALCVGGTGVTPATCTGGIKAGDIVSSSISAGTAPALSGGVRLSNAGNIQARNAANSADVQMIAVNASNKVAMDTGGAGIVFGSSGVQVLTTAGKIQSLSSTYLADLSGANLTSINAAALATNTVPTARLGSGSATSSTFLRGDSSWQAISLSAGAWTAPTLQGDWSNLGGGVTDSGYRKLNDADTVMIRGVVTSSGNSQGSGAPIFTLPSGYRPSKILIVSGTGYSSESAGTTVQIRIDTSGHVYVQSADSTNGYISLDGIVFSIS